MVKILRREKYVLPDKGRVRVEICRSGDSIYAWSKSVDAFGGDIARHEVTIEPAPGKLEHDMTMAAREVKRKAVRDVEWTHRADVAAKEIDI